MAPRRSWTKADNPYWSTHVATWYRGHQEAEEYCRRRKLSRTTFDRWTRHLVSQKDLRKRTERLQKVRWNELERQAKKGQPKRRRRPPRYRYSARTDSGPIALRAFWSMHVEAMNWSGMGLAEYAAALGLSPHALRIWRDRLEESGDEMDWRSLLHPSTRAQLSSAANCARRKYRLTPQTVDGRSNRRRFSDEQKRAIVQETEKPGVSVAQVCRRHGIATSMVFRWHVEFGLTARNDWVLDPDINVDSIDWAVEKHWEGDDAHAQGQHGKDKTDRGAESDHLPALRRVEDSREELREGLRWRGSKERHINSLGREQPASENHQQ